MDAEAEAKAKAEAEARRRAAVEALIQGHGECGQWKEELGWLDDAS